MYMHKHYVRLKLWAQKGLFIDSDFSGMRCWEQGLIAVFAELHRRGISNRKLPPFFWSCTDCDHTVRKLIDGWAEESRPLHLFNFLEDRLQKETLDRVIETTSQLLQNDPIGCHQKVTATLAEFFESIQPESCISECVFHGKVCPINAWPDCT